MTPVPSVIPLSQVTSAYASSATGSAGGVDFATLAGDAAHSALQTLRQGEQSTASGVAGKSDVQSVVMALSNAEVTMQAVVEIRDKVVAAYNDIMHMSV
jgi:flagellar hook-basal body complex protein FliE